MEAYWWNLDFVKYIGYPGAFEHSFDWRYYWSRAFYCSQNPGDSICEV
jgi:hypothetical protein